MPQHIERRAHHQYRGEFISYNYQVGVFYMDIVAELEKMGDFMINVSEAKIAENG